MRSQIHADVQSRTAARWACHVVGFLDDPGPGIIATANSGALFEKTSGNTINPLAAVPGPVVGAGMPGVIAACLTLLGLAKLRLAASGCLTNSIGGSLCRLPLIPPAPANPPGSKVPGEFLRELTPAMRYNTMKRLLYASVALLAMASVSHAALITDLGLDPTSRNGDFASGALGVNGTGAGIFDDQFKFQLDGLLHLTIASATNVFPGGATSTDFIKNFSASVFNYGADGIFHTADDVRVLGPANATMGCGLIVNCQGMAGTALLTAGNYYLDISGTGGGTSGYGGNIATSAAAVPGPVVGAGAPGLVAGAMFLFGLAKRRRNRSAV